MTRQGKQTIRDVAREAGVGLGTASRVLSESRHVSAATRQCVLEAVERLGFRPSRMAQGLARGRTQTLGVVVPFFTKHYFLEILRGIEQAVSAHDYSLIVYNVERREQALARFFDVSPAYFFDEELTEFADGHVRLLAAARSETLRRMAATLLGLSDESLDSVLALASRLRHLEGLPGVE